MWWPSATLPEALRSDGPLPRLDEGKGEFCFIAGCGFDAFLLDDYNTMNAHPLVKRSPREPAVAETRARSQSSQSDVLVVVPVCVREDRVCWRTHKTLSRICDGIFVSQRCVARHSKVCLRQRPTTVSIENSTFGVWERVKTGVWALER